MGILPGVDMARMAMPRPRWLQLRRATLIVYDIFDFYRNMMYCFYKRHNG